MIKQMTILSVFLMTSCGLFGGKKISGATLKINKDAVIEDGSKEISVKENEEVSMPSSSFIVKSAGSIPVYVIPLKSDFRKVEVNLAPLTSNEIAGVYKKKINTSLSESLFDIHEIQNEIFRKKYNRALALIDESEKKYGNVDFLSYMKASVFYLNGEKLRAKQILTSLVEAGNKDKKITSFLKEIE